MMLLIEIVVGVLAVVAVAAVILGARSDDREASAKLDLLCAEFVKARDENIVLVDALKRIVSLDLADSDYLGLEALHIAQQALARVGKAKRVDRDDVTPQPWRRNA